MKTAAIICEYNPFHNGHQYQIEQIRAQRNADHIIAIMSGDFVQRGMPAFCDKYTRAEFALKNGADLVIELPVCYACSSAPYFAFGAISLLNALNGIDDLVFGTESSSLSEFDSCIRVFEQEPEEYRIRLKELLKQGISFPAARAKAVSFILGKDLSHLLERPNNILALEYQMALSASHSSIQPYAIKRIGADYHDTSIRRFSSATGIRNQILENGIGSALKQTVPANVYQTFLQHYQKDFPLEWNDFYDMLQYQLIMDLHPETYLDYHPELMDRILKYKDICQDVESLISRVKSKNFTYARISRYLLHLMLKITKKQASSPCGYAKILGMKKSHSSLLKHLNQTSSIPLIQKTAQYKNNLTGDALSSFEQTLTASALYRCILQKKYASDFPSELERPLLIV